MKNTYLSIALHTLRRPFLKHNNNSTTHIKIMHSSCQPYKSILCATILLLMPSISLAQETQPAPAQSPAAKNKIIDGNTEEEIRLTPDKTGLIQLSRPAVNVVVGNSNTLRVIPDTNQNLVLVPKEPGATFFRAIDADGNVIMQRHVIVAAPEKKYIRIRRSCNTGTQAQSSGNKTCHEYSVYYCPDICHEVDVTAKGEGKNIPSMPETAPQTQTENTNNNDRIIIINPNQSPSVTNEDNPDTVSDVTIDEE